MTNRSIGSHNPFREVESAMLCQHRLNFLRDELPIVRVYERHVFRDRWRLAAGVEAMDPEQLGRPVVETAGLNAQLPVCAIRCPSAR